MNELISIEMECFIHEWDDILQYTAEGFKIHDISELNEGDIVVCKFPWLNGTGFSEIRPALLLRYPDDKLYFVRFSRLKSAKKDVVRAKRVLDDNLNYILHDIENTGLREPSILVPSYYYPFAMIENIKRIGRMNPKDLILCKDKIKNFIPTKLNDPWHLLGWMKANDIEETTHPSGNNNNCKIQTLSDLEISHKANCVDIANFMHELCAKNNIRHYICNTHFSIPGKGSGHIYVIFYDHWTDGYSVFRYFPKDKKHETLCGDIVRGRSRDITFIMKEEASWLKPEFIRIFGTEKLYCKNTILSSNQMKIWDMHVTKKSTQKELLYDVFWKNHSFGLECFNLNPLNDLR